MKKFIPYIIIGVLTVGISIETTILIMQSGKINDLEAANTNLSQEVNKNKEKIAEESQNAQKEIPLEVITATYKEFSKFKELNKADIKYYMKIFDIKDKLNVIFESYTGNDTDIKDMIEAINKYVDNALTERLIPKEDEDAKLYNYKQAVLLYDAANKAINKCISKYALFDKVGLK